MLKIVRNLDNPLKSGLLQQPASEFSGRLPWRRTSLEMDRYRPPPSPCRPPSFSAAAARAVSLCSALANFAPIGPNTGPNIRRGFERTTLDWIGLDKVVRKKSIFICLFKRP
jgi:hypothetical protein